MSAEDDPAGPAPARQLRARAPPGGAVRRHSGGSGGTSVQYSSQGRKPSGRRSVRYVPSRWLTKAVALSSALRRSSTSSDTRPDARGNAPATLPYSAAPSQSRAGPAASGSMTSGLVRSRKSTSSNSLRSASGPTWAAWAPR
ncbi:hypothetical protein ABZ767_04835 [Streptomyces pseudogriseolus]|uniref:hypothetical protein n=1 Tax=Streptomyces pseudogriseolus TaxID=36817 RepID=UPI003492340B